MKNELVKSAFQEAFNEYKEQYMEDIAPSKKKKLESLFNVSLNEAGGLCVDGKYIGFNVSDCDDSESFSWKMEAEQVCVFIGNFTTVAVYLSCEYGQYFPEIYSVKVNKKEVYSF